MMRFRPSGWLPLCTWSAVVVAGASLPAAAAPLDDALVAAAAAQDADSVRRLLAAGASPNATGDYGTSVLHWAVHYDNLELAAQLLAARADPARANSYGLTPSQQAVENASPALLEALLAAGAPVDALDPAGETLLMVAARIGNPQVVEILLRHGAAVDTREATTQQTALMIAARGNHAGVARLLLVHGADPDARTRVGREPEWILPNSVPGFSFGIGIIRGGLPADRGRREPIPGGLSPLLYAARHGSTPVAELLIEAGASLELADPNGITPLLMAISNNRMPTAQLLINAGAEVNVSDWYGRTPLWEAVNVRNLYLHGATLENGVDRAPVLELIRVLLDRGADPNARTAETPPFRDEYLSIGSLEWVDFTGQTPFLSAALSGDVTVMKLLLEQGADPHIETYAGTTALMAAAGVNWVVDQTYDEGPDALLEAVKLCWELGMDVNAANSMGIAAIHGAANRGSNDIIRFLVDKGARLDIADNEGRTPLDWAKGVFLATHPAAPKPESVALIEELLSEDS